MLGATLGLALTLAGCASGGGDPHQATGAWAACAPSPPVAFTILCIQQRAVVSEK